MTEELKPQTLNPEPEPEAAAQAVTEAPVTMAETVPATETEAELEAASQSWLPDAGPVATEPEVTEPEAPSLVAAPSAEPEPEPQVTAGIATWVENPSSIHTLEIADAQNLSEDADLELDADLQLDADLDLPTEAETEARFDQLETSMIAETAKQAGDPVEQAAEQAALDALRLAEEIVEDQAVAAALNAPQVLEEIAQAAAEQPLAPPRESLTEPDTELLEALPAIPTEYDSEGNLDLTELESCIEALLFMSDKPLSAEKLRELLSPPAPEPEEGEAEGAEPAEAGSPPAPEPEGIKLSLFQEALTALRVRYQRPCHGFELVQVAGGFQFRTKPGRAALAKKLAKVQTQKLSTGAMETLAIVAYRQPVMKEDVDKVRGVDSSYFVRGLLEKKLIRISGRSELPGRPMLYSTTQEFMELFGLKDLASMPPLRELEQMVPGSQAGAPEEDPRVREMRRLVGEMKADTSVSLIYNPREDEKILHEIREKVNAIPTSTPYVDQLKSIEEEAKLASRPVAFKPEAQTGQGVLLGGEPETPPPAL